MTGLTAGKKKFRGLAGLMGMLLLLAVGPPVRASTRFMLTGDSRSSDSATAFNSEILEEIVQAALSEQVEFILFTGDLVWGYGTAAVSLEDQLLACLLGVIAVQHYQEEGALDEPQRHLLELIATQATVALQNAWNYQESQRQVRELSSLRQVGQAITSSISDPAQVLHEVVKGAHSVMEADIVALFPMDGEEFQPPDVAFTIVGDRGALPPPL